MKNVSAENFQNVLHKLGACSSARVWASGKDLKTVWETCPRADWLLWLLAKQSDKLGWVTKRQVVLLAAKCARTSLPYVPEGEDRPLRVIEAAEGWARGEVLLSKLHDAVAAVAAVADAAVADAAANAANAANTAAYAADAPYRDRLLLSMADMIRAELCFNWTEL